MESRLEYLLTTKLVFLQLVFLPVKKVVVCSLAPSKCIVMWILRHWLCVVVVVVVVVVLCISGVYCVLAVGIYCVFGGCVYVYTVYLVVVVD